MQPIEHKFRLKHKKSAATSLGDLFFEAMQSISLIHATAVGYRVENALKSKF